MCHIHIFYVLLQRLRYTCTKKMHTLFCFLFLFSFVFVEWPVHGVSIRFIYQCSTRLLDWPGSHCMIIFSHGPLATYVKLRVAHVPGMPGTFSPPPQVSDSDMHHGTCMMHVPWCMPVSLTSVFFKSVAGKTFNNPQFYVSGKRPMWAQGSISLMIFPSQFKFDGNVI